MSSTSSEAMQVRFRTVDAITIRYAESDERQDNPILLTNPWPESLYAFLPIWQTLSQYSYLLAIDLPGFGQSERRNDLLSPQAMGEFLIRIIDAPNLDAFRATDSRIAIGSALDGHTIETLTENFALELAPIRVNTIACGFVDTPLTAALLGEGLQARREELERTLPIHRVVQAEDVAKLAVHLMLNTAITGSIHAIDGGQSLL